MRAAIRRLRAALLGMALVATGCGSAMTDTLKSEDTLAVLSSQVAHAVDGADALLEVKTRTLMATSEPGAKAFYGSYKPAIEKARQAVHTAQDVVTDAEAVRSRIPASDGGTCAAGCMGVAADFTAWFPAMGRALTSLEQAYSDLKSLVQK